jgi:outer membrane protein OmpA-like peptidoglycan-associated protein
MKASLCIALCLATQLCTAQADAKGCKDSPLISRFPGSFITQCKDMADDSFRFDNLGPKKESKTIEGELHQLNYNYPKTASKAQVVRNLHTALQTAGYTFLYDSGDYGDFTVQMGKTRIAIEVSGGNWYRETIVIETQLTQDVVADAAALSSGLSTAGHIVVKGILFDTGKSEVKPESAPALQEVVKMLKQDPKIKVYVVGHTDNVGALAANIDLSKRRAAAVVQELTTKYGVEAARLQAFGDGPYAPISSNDSEDGRSLNRRVELVKQ